jgi:phosphomannomutase
MDAFFHAYDVRGRYPGELSPTVGERLGRAIARTLPGPFLLARDTRRESAYFETALTHGLERAGAHVTLLGVLPTPTVAFAARWRRRYALAVTPSHNPVGYTGLKGFDPKGRIFAREWTRIRQAFHKEDLGSPAPKRSTGPGRGDPKRIEADYVRWVTRGLRARIPVVVDPRGGASARLALATFRALGARVHAIDARFSATFFGRSPEPTGPEVEALGRRTRRVRAVLGVTFDGDGDRVLFVGGDGWRIEPEEVALLIYRATGRRGPLVASVDASHRLEELAPVRRSRVGTRYVLEAMRRTGASVGVEASSHIYWAGGPESSDGIRVAARLAHLLAQQPEALAGLRKEMGPIFRQAGAWNFPTFEAAAGAYAALRTSLGRRARPGPDGFYVRVGPAGCLVRRSNTQPIVRFALEAGDPRTLALGAETVRRWLGPLRRGAFTWAEAASRAERRP